MDDTEIGQLTADIAAGSDWFSAKTCIGSLPSETAYVFLRVLGEALPLDCDVEAAIDGPEDIAGHILAGSALMVHATRIRGMDTADRVAEENWQHYFAYRERAEVLLRHASDRDIDNGLAAAWFMASVVDSDEGTKSEAARALTHAEAVPISGYSKLLSAQTEKWGGSHEEMWTVARRYAGNAEPWSRALVAKAHYEHWLYLDLMDERPQAEWEAGAYFRNPEVRAELEEISQAVFAAQADDPYLAVFAHDVLAAAMAEAGMRRAATRHLRKVGKYGDPALLTGGSWASRILVRLVKGLAPW